MVEKGKRLNEAIRSEKVRLIGGEGEQLGIVSLAEALKKAQELEVDLVEIGTEKEGFPIAKLMDYGKFLFKQQKNISKNRVQSKQADLKTVKITYKIGDHDLQIRREQALKFGKAGHPLRVMLQLR